MSIKLLELNSYASALSSKLRGSKLRRVYVVKEGKVETQFAVKNERFIPSVYQEKVVKSLSNDKAIFEEVSKASHVVVGPNFPQRSPLCINLSCAIMNYDVNELFGHIEFVIRKFHKDMPLMSHEWIKLAPNYFHNYRQLLMHKPPTVYKPANLKLSKQVANARISPVPWEDTRTEQDIGIFRMTMKKLLSQVPGAEFDKYLAEVNTFLNDCKPTLVHTPLDGTRPSRKLVNTLFTDLVLDSANFVKVIQVILKHYPYINYGNHLEQLMNVTDAVKHNMPDVAKYLAEQGFYCNPSAILKECVNKPDAAWVALHTWMKQAESLRDVQLAAGVNDENWLYKYTRVYPEYMENSIELTKEIGLIPEVTNLASVHLYHSNAWSCKPNTANYANSMLLYTIVVSKFPNEYIQKYELSSALREYIRRCEVKDGYANVSESLRPIVSLMRQMMIESTPILSRRGVPNSQTAAKIEVPAKIYGPKAEECEKVSKNYIGINKVKAFFDSLMRDYDNQKLLRDLKMSPSIVDRSLNFAFVGNAGLGKTSIASMLSNQLVRFNMCGRTSKHYAGANLGNIKLDCLIKEIDPIVNGGGVIIVDDIGALNPLSNVEGRKILNYFMQIAAQHKQNVGLIFIDTKETMLNDVFGHFPGALSNFEMVHFEDFTDDELLSCWNLYCKNRAYECDSRTATVVQRRLMNQRKMPSFANAISVRNVFNSAALNAIDEFCIKTPKTAAPLSISIKHVVGPDPNENIHLKAAMKDLNALVGMPEVKKSIHSIITNATANYYRELEGDVTMPIWLNKVFVGNPGTGKTTVAQIYARILKNLGLLSKEEIVSKTSSDFIGDHVGQSSQKTASILKMSEGKVLVIDEAIGFQDGGSNGILGANAFGKQVLDTLVEKISGSPGEDRAVIMIGYEEPMMDMFRHANPGLSRRFDVNNPFRFTDYTDDELFSVATKMFAARHISNVSFATLKAIIDKVSIQRTLANFGNIGTVETVIVNAVQRMTQRQAKMLSEEDIHGYDAAAIAKQANPMSVLDELEDVGGVKQKLLTLYRNIRIAKAQGRDISAFIENYVFLGNPGTGKTEIAKKLGQLYHAFKLLPTSNCIVTSALDLTGNYLGQSKSKVEELMNQALGGVLLIDEAYNLGFGVYGKEVQDKLLQMLTEDKYKGKMVVVLAGYRTKMNEMFTNNHGFKSRFGASGIIDFPDWTMSEVAKLTIQAAKKESPAYIFEEEGKVMRLITRDLVRVQNEDPASWANARDAITLFKLIRKEQLNRLDASDDISSNIITCNDVELAIQEFVNARKIHNNTSFTPASTSPMNHPPVNQTPTPPTPSKPPVDIKHTKIADVLMQGQDQSMPVHTHSHACSHQHQVHTKDPIEGDDGSNNAGNNNRKDIISRTMNNITNLMRNMDPSNPYYNSLVQEYARLDRLSEEEVDEKELTALEVKEKLRMMGKCEAGYEWIDEGHQYRCAGGSHTVSKADMDRVK